MKKILTIAILFSILFGGVAGIFPVSKVEAYSEMGDLGDIKGTIVPTTNGRQQSGGIQPLVVSHPSALAARKSAENAWFNANQAVGVYNRALTGDSAKKITDEKTLGILEKKAIDALYNARRAVTFYDTANVPNTTDQARQDAATGANEAEQRVKNSLNEMYKPAETSERHALQQAGIQAEIDDNSCWPSWGSLNPGVCAKDAVAWTLYIIIVILAGLVKLGGLLLDLAIQFSVLNISANLDSMPSIMSSWKIVRDLANMTFIFILLYVAITTILQVNSSNAKKILGQVVIAAIFINFSIFFVKVVIDFSNIVTLFFYNSLALKGSMSDGLMQIIGLPTVFKDATSTHNEVFSWMKDWGTFVGMSFGSIIIMFVAAFSFMAAAFLFIFRFVMIIILIVLSPIAIAAKILPATQKYANQWFEALMGQALFPILYMFMIWLSFQILGSTNEILGRGSFSTALSATQAEGKSADLGIVINFILAMVLINAALVMAKTHAVKGAGKAAAWLDKGLGAVDWAKKRTKQVGVNALGKATAGTVGAVGRNTVGAIGASVRTSGALNRGALSKNALVRGLSKAVIGVGKKADDANFDLRNTPVASGLGAGVKGGYTKQLEEKTKLVLENTKRYGAATGDTRKELGDKQDAVSEANKLYVEAMKLDPKKDKNASQKKADAIQNLRDAQEALGKTEKKAAGETKALQRQYLTDMATRRQPSRGFYISKKYKEAVKQFTKPEKKEEEDQFKLDLAKDQLDAVLEQTAGISRGNMENPSPEVKALQDKIKTIINKGIKPNQIKDIKADILKNDWVAEQLDKNRLEALKRSEKFNDDDLSEIGKIINKTPGAVGKKYVQNAKPENPFYVEGVRGNRSGGNGGERQPSVEDRMRAADSGEND